MIYVYRRGPSSGARELVRALGGRRLRNLQARQFTSDDVIICWGEAINVVPEFPPRVLNWASLRDKLQDALRLAQAGVPTVEVSQVRPVAEIVPDPLPVAWDAILEQFEGLEAIRPSRDNPMFLYASSTLRDAVQRLEEILETPAPAIMPAAEWLGRLRHHVGGGDLLNPPANPDYWVRKEHLVREFRVHSFEGQSIRAGVKKIREGLAGPEEWGIRMHAAHPWIRSHEAGWRISYDGVTITRAHRDLAHAAVQALGLSFGAVDLGERVDGTLLVLEVNRAPGLEGGTITAYAEAIQRWIAAGGQS